MLNKAFLALTILSACAVDSADTASSADEKLFSVLGPIEATDECSNAVEIENFRCYTEYGLIQCYNYCECAADCDTLYDDSPSDRATCKKVCRETTNQPIDQGNCVDLDNYCADHTDEPLHTICTTLADMICRP